MRPCFECGALTSGSHHVVPRSRGGKRSLPLCVVCHGISRVFPELERQRFLEARLPNPGDRLDVDHPTRGALRVLRERNGTLVVYRRPSPEQDEALDKLAGMLCGWPSSRVEALFRASRSGS